MKLLACMVLAALVLSGCAGGSPAEQVSQEDVPDEIDRQRLDDVASELVSKFPRRFSFPGQLPLESVTRFINDTVAIGTGVASPELPNDNGLVETNPTIIRHDVSEHVPMGQPVEMRIKLKWWGNPGASGDLDIFVDVPGMRDAFDPDSFDESFNWNIVTKFRVVNTVRVEGKPFDVGIQVSNSKILVDGMRYSLRIDFDFPQNVLAPGVAYAVTVPQNASRLVFESEPVSGDEHITGEFLVVGPDDRLHSHVQYDDIGVDARVISTPVPGEYVLYAPKLRGGFLKVLTDVPNENFQARMLPMEERSQSLVTGVITPVGQSATFELDSFPLELHAWLRPTGSSPLAAAARAALNITSDAGWVSTTMVTASLQGSQFGRLGERTATANDFSNLQPGAHRWTAEGSIALAMDAGYRYVTYTR